jgi:transcriptional regulator with XRE-family HTH domain
MPASRDAQDAVAAYRAAVAAVLRQLRTARGWSYREFGERVGVAHTSLYAVERLETTPAVETLAGVAAACDLALPALLALIVDALQPGERNATLAGVLTAAAPLSDAQRAELLGFIAYLRFRERQSDNSEQ